MNAHLSKFGICRHIAGLDHTISCFFQPPGNARVRRMVTAFTRLGNIYWALPIYGLIYVWRGCEDTRLLWAVLGAELLGTAIIVPLRYLFRRQRPMPYHASGRFAPWNCYSFPSHHAYRAFMLCGLIGSVYPWMLAGLLPWAIAIGLSRIYLSRHFLSDVITGALLGLMVGYGIGG
jgi:undecaprenyl-diphosphatase